VSGSATDVGRGPFSPTRLDLARRRRGMSRTLLAERLQVSTRTLQRWERGEATPDAVQCAVLADVLSMRPAFFARDDLDPLPETAVSFRALSKLPAGERDTALAAGRLGVELVAWIRQRFGLPATDVPTLPGWDPETAADSVRARWNLGTRPIPGLLAQLELHGIRVLSLAPEARSVDAFSFYWSTEPYVFLDTTKSGERLRFDAAHELGHLVLHCEHGAPQGREAEQQAHRFAGALLMPRAAVLAANLHHATVEQVLRAKRTWRVAAMALTHRLHELGLLTDWRYRDMCIELNRRGYRRSEPDGVPHETSQVLGKVFSALRARKVGVDQIADELGWQPRDVGVHLFGLALTAHPGGAEPAPDPTGPDATRPNRPRPLRALA